jgi:hypothetical protein
MTEFLLTDKGIILDTCTTYRKEDASELIFKRDRKWLFSSTAKVLTRKEFNNI